MSERGTYEGLGDDFIVDIDAELAEDARRLDRYDEAIRLLRLREPGCSGDGEFISSVDLNKLTAAFLADEGKVAG